MTTHDYVLEYLRRGWCPTPIRATTKQPMLRDWQNFRATSHDIVEYWSNGQGVGLVLGPSKLTDIDFDTDAAVSLAPRFLPPTGMVGGHDGRPSTHWFYNCQDIVTEKFSAPGEGRPLIEIRAGNCQTVVAPSTHPGGSLYRWFDAEQRSVKMPGEPSMVPAAELRRAVAKLASASLLAQHWPTGRRHEAALALAGSLKRAGWTVQSAKEFIAAVVAGAQDPEERDRIKAVEDTFKRAGDDPTTGLSRLSEVLGQEVANRIRDWLDLRPERVEVALVEDMSGRAGDSWPKPLELEAYYGVAGDLVKVIEPATEADPAALLVQFLVAFGNLIGQTASAIVEGDRHGTNEYTVLVGSTSRGRKGTSWGRIRSLLAEIDPTWADGHIASGLSSGEGLIWSVRDEVRRTERVDDDPPRYEEVVVDVGVTDKRLLVVEPEFASVLKCCERLANTLSATLRSGWDSGTFRQLVKNSPVRATDAHVSIIGHITKEELLRLLTSTEAANGLGNRFLWVCARRSKVLPEGGTPNVELLQSVQERLTQAVAFAQTLDAPIRRDARAAGLWREVYPCLTADRPGLWGSITARAEAHVLRLSMIYAVLDQSPEVRVEHLMAALAVWQYCEDSARCIWGDSTGDELADEILKLLRAAPEGLSRRELHDFTGRNHTASRLSRALGVLLRYKLATRLEARDTGGRPAERWLATRTGGRS